MTPAWYVSSLAARVPREVETPKWCFALRSGMRTTVVSRAVRAWTDVGECEDTPV